MTRAQPLNVATPLRDNAGASVPLGAPATYTADASKVSSRDFLDAITGRSDATRAAEREQMIRQCINAIERGDTYGWPPALIAECREIMAAEDSGWGLAEKSAFGMGRAA